MAKRTWDKATAEGRIKKRLAEVETIKIKEYVKETDLTVLKSPRIPEPVRSRGWGTV